MKTSLRFTAVVITLFITAFTYAQTISNNLVVFSQDGYKFTLIVNGLKQNTDPQTNVKVVGLNAPNYKVRVIFEDTKKAPIDQNIGMMWGGETLNNKELTCAIVAGKKGLKLKPQSVADISGPSTSSATQVVYQYNPSSEGTMVGSTTTTTTTTSGSSTTTTGNNGAVSINTGVTGNGTGGSTTTTVNDGMGGTTSTTTTTSTTSTGNGANTNVGVNAGGVGVGINININDGMGGMGGTTSSTTTTTTTSSSSSSTSTNMGGGTTTTTTSAGGNNVASSSQCSFPMSSSDFAKAKASIDKQSFEDEKLKVAKQILNTNCMSTAQVKEVMGMFTFEETKLDWAKYAYGKTTDPNNYYQLNDGFTYSSSTDALDEYIKQHPHQ